MDNRKVVFYIRLSLEDRKTGSLSISTQKQILYKNFLEIPEYSSSEVVELIDNGYSGTTFDRPSLNILMEMVKQREVACIMIKDFSRLGRDLSQVGYLTESVFPLFYTRLISVNDNYDSNDHYESTGGLEVTFRFLMSEQYSNDLSKKISATKQNKIKKGEYVIKNPFYGYKLDENRRYIIDEAVADNVRLIFELRQKGLRTNGIISELYSRKILTPTEYKRTYIENYKSPSFGEGVWGKSTIENVLRDIRYTGTYSGGLAFNGGSFKNVGVEVNIPNNHPAIISEELFNKVQEGFNALEKTRNARTIPVYPLKGKIYCAICNHKLSYIKANKNARFYCKSKKAIAEFECSETVIPLSVLTGSVFIALKERILNINVTQDDTFVEAQSVLENSDLSHTVKNLKQAKKKNYELMVSGEISKEEYLIQNDNLSLELEKVTLIIESAHTEEAIKEAIMEKNLTLQKLVNIIEDSTELTLELAEKFIKKVFVYPDNSLNIEYMFDNLVDKEE